MRRSLLNKRILPKPLRQVLVLITLLLLPSAAWGQDITIAGIGPNGDGKFINGTTSEQISGVEYNSGSNTLTLTDATIEGQIVWSKEDATLIIEINGSNVIRNTEGSVIKTTIANNTYEVKFMKGSVVEDSKTLILRKGGSGPTIEGFDYNDANQKGIGLYQIKANDGFAITTEAYELQIGINGTMTWVHNLPEYTNIGYKNDIFGEGQYQAVFDDDNKKLTLDNATINSTSSDALISGLDKLTIDLVGSNSITAAGNYYAISGYNSSTYMVGSTGEKFEIEISTSTTTGQLTLTRGSDPGLTNNVNVSYKRVVPTFSSPTGATSLETASVAFIAIKQYNLTVAGVPVTSANCEDILDGNNARKVSFTPANEDNGTPATLTLNNATLNGGIIWNNGSNALIVKLDGMNYIETSTNDPAFKATASCDLYIKKNNPNNDATVKFSGSIVDFNSQPDDGFKQIFDAITPCSYYTTKTVYGISIGGTDLHDISGVNGYLNTSTGAITGMDHISFALATVSPDAQTPGTPATLTLDGATINGKIKWNSSDNLTIALNGKNTIVSEEGGELFKSEQSCTLFIAKADNADATLKYASYSESNGKIANATGYFSGFSPITPSSDFNLTPFTVQVDGINYNYYTTEAYPVTVAGRQVHNISGEPGNKDDILGDGKVKFDGGSSTLTLDNAKISVTTLDGKGIETSLEALTIDLKGTNSITSSGYSFYGTTGGTGSRTINITSTSTPAGKLTLSSSTALAKDVTVSSTVYDLQSINWNNSNALIAIGFTGLTIAGTPITSDNIGTNGVISGVSGITSGTVSFAEAQSDPETPATLTLDNASITGDIKFNASLTVHLVGDNTITKPEDTSSSYAFDLGNTARDLNFSTDETKPGTLKIVGSYSGLQNHGIIYYGRIKGGDATIGTTGDVIWKQTFITDATPSYFILSLNKHYNLWKNGHQYHDLILDNNDSYVFNPEKSTLTIINSSSSDYINSGLKNLTIIVSGSQSQSQSLSYIAFGAPKDTQAEGITTGTLTITGDKTNEGSNSLTLSNPDGVITGFSSVDITLPMHVSYTTPSEFSGWTSNVTEATITDETDDAELSDRFFDDINYVTYYSPDRDMFLSNALTPSVITEISGSTVKTQALSYIPKKTPVLVTKATNTATTATFSKNLLKFAESDNAVTASEGKVLYVLYNDQFVKVTPDSRVEYGGYLDLTDVNLPSGTRSLTIDGDDEGTTALREVRSEGVKGEKWDDGEWYTLQGRKFTTKPTKPGLYILNGKKVVIK